MLPILILKKSGETFLQIKFHSFSYFYKIQDKRVTSYVLRPKYCIVNHSFSHSFVTFEYLVSFVTQTKIYWYGNFFANYLCRVINRQIYFKELQVYILKRYSNITHPQFHRIISTQLPAGLTSYLTVVDPYRIKSPAETLDTETPLPLGAQLLVVYVGRKVYHSLKKQVEKLQEFHQNGEEMIARFKKVNC